VRRVPTCFVLSTLAFASAPVLQAECKLRTLAVLPVTMDGLTPIISARVNGSEAKFIADSGAFYSSITPAGAAEFKLPLKSAPNGFYIMGIGGKAQAKIGTVKEFTLAGSTFRNVEFIVGGSDTRGGTVGLLGQNILRIADVEYSLA